MAFNASSLDNYVDVAERLATFREKYPEGSMQPADRAVPYRIETIDGKTYVAVVAAAYRSPDDSMPGIGMAWEPVPGQTPYTKDSELQNAETAAWGRAVVAALAADTKKIASRDEVRNRRGADTTTATIAPEAVPSGPGPALVARVNRLADSRERTRCMKDLVANLGRLDELADDRVAEAEAIVAKYELGLVATNGNGKAA